MHLLSKLNILIPDDLSLHFLIMDEVTKGVIPEIVVEIYKRKPDAHFPWYIIPLSHLSLTRTLIREPQLSLDWATCLGKCVY